MNAARLVAFFGGLVVIVVLLARLPDDLFRSAQGFLLATSGLLFVLFAGGIVLSPVRVALGRLLGYGVEARKTASVASSDEMRALMRPLFVALVLLAAAEVPALLR